MAIYLGKINLWRKSVSRDISGHYRMIEESVQQEDTIIITIYTSNMRALKHIKQTY